MKAGQDKRCSTCATKGCGRRGTLHDPAHDMPCANPDHYTPQDTRPIDPVIDRLIREAQAQGCEAGRYSDHACDLSGQWADRMSGPQVLEAVAAACGLTREQVEAMPMIDSEVLDAYEDAYNAAACDASELFECRDCVNEGYCDAAVRAAHTAHTIIPQPEGAARDIEIGGLHCLTRDVATIVKVVQPYEAAYVVAYNATACDVVRPQDIGAAMHPDCVACGVPLYADDDDGGIVWDSGRNGWAHAACEQAEQAPRGADLVNALCASLHEIEGDLRVTRWTRDMERPHRLGTFGWHSPSLEDARDRLEVITDGIARLEQDGIDRLAQDTRRKLDRGESIDG